MGRYATREDQLDRLLRAKRFVDLHMVARQALRAGVERYALKELEAFYDFKRTIDLRTASLHLRAFERALELGRHDEVPHATRDAIEAYNRDDCVSTMRLRDWLEQFTHRFDRRRPRDRAAGAGERRAARSSRRAPATRAGTLRTARRRRLAGPSRAQRRAAGALGAREHAGLASTREEGRRRSGGSIFVCARLADEDLLAEKAALAGLEFALRIATPKRSVVDRYRFPPQECEIREGDDLHHQGKRFGKVEAIDVAAGQLTLADVLAVSQAAASLVLLGDPPAAWAASAGQPS
jgi:hypothetical protein